MLKFRVLSIIVAAILVCYIGAGFPSIFALFKPSVLHAAWTLKYFTYQEDKYFDTQSLISDLSASRFYILLLAFVCATTGTLIFKEKYSMIISMSALLLAIIILVVLCSAENASERSLAL
jgi:hypothetical protein